MSIPPENQPPLSQNIEELAARIDRLTRELAELKSGLAVLQSSAERSAEQPAGEAEVVRAEVIEPSNIAMTPSSTPALGSDAELQPAQSSQSPSQPTTSARGKQAIQDLEKLIGGRWMTWIGATTMLVAVAFFIPWAWQYFQTPEWFKVLALHASSLGILVFGLWICRRDFSRLGHAIAGIGLFAWYGTALAGLRTFDVYAKWFGDGKYVFTALECSLITLVAIVLAVRRRSVGIILLGALGGYLNPILTSSGEANYVVFFVYLAFLNIGLITSAILRNWNFLKLIAFFATTIMFMGCINVGGGRSIPLWQVEWLAVLHAVIFLFGVTLPPMLWREKSRTVDLMTLVGTSTGFMALTWNLFHGSAQSQLGSVAAGLALLHLLLFAVTRQRVSDQDRMPRTHLALALLFLTLIAPLQLENLNYLSVAWAVEGLVLMGIGLYYRDRQFLVSAVLVYCLSAYRMSMESHVDSLQLLLVSLLMLIGGSLAWWMPRRVPNSEGEGKGLQRARPNHWESITGGIALGLGNIMVMVTIFHYFHTGDEPIPREMLVGWTLDLLVVWMLGLIFHRLAVRIYAAIVVWLPVSIVALGTEIDFHWAGDYFQPFVPVVNGRFAALALLAGVAFAIASGYRHYFFPAAADEAPLRRAERPMRYVMGVYGCFVLFMAINLDIENYFASYTGQWWKAELATYSVAWILFAVAVVVWGFITQSLFYRVLGLLAFAPILLKVFLVDLSQLDQLARILAAFVLGLALLGISFLYQRVAARVLE